MATRFFKLVLTLLLVIPISVRLFSPELGDSNGDNQKGHKEQISPEIRPLTPEQIQKFNSLLVGSQLPVAVSQDIDQLLRLQGFNGTAAIARRGEVLYRGSFGMADFSSQRPIALDDQFQLASVSKQFTAMAVMMLEERGKLNYDDLYASHVPEFPYPGVTIRQLLNHTAGMPNYMSLLERYWPYEVLPDNEDMLRMLVKYKPGLYFTPGRRFDYSNTGYALLALLVERIGQRPFDQFLEEEIFVPLGMWDTFVYSPTRQKRGQRQLTAYHRYRRRWEATPETLHEEIHGDKGVYSTAEDMLKWDRALFRCALVPFEQLQEAFSPLTLRNGRHLQYGFGFRIEDNPDDRVVFHYGRWNSFSTCIFRNLDNDYTLILLSNVKKNLDPLQKKIRALLPIEEERTLPLPGLPETIDWSGIHFVFEIMASV